MKEFDELYCDHCMCQDDSCRMIENARTWIKIHADLIEKSFFPQQPIGKNKYFEDWAKDYPGAFRPFMIAWCDEFGGI